MYVLAALFSATAVARLVVSFGPDGATTARTAPRTATVIPVGTPLAPARAGVAVGIPVQG